MTDTNDPFDGTFDETAWAADGTINSDASTAAAVETAMEEEAVVEKGRAEGREAGLLEGFKEGRLLGQTTGVEYGMEIGFATGLLEAVRESIKSGGVSTPSSGSLDRIVKSADDLERAIRDFPSSEDAIRKRLFRSGEGGNIDKELDGRHDVDDEELQTRSGSSEEDIRAKLQRIRARCKVLAAKLGIPHHSLKTVLAEASRNRESAAASSTPSLSTDEGVDQEW